MPIARNGVQTTLGELAEHFGIPLYGVHRPLGGSEFVNKEPRPCKIWGTRDCGRCGSRLPSNLRHAFFMLIHTCTRRLLLLAASALMPTYILFLLALIDYSCSTRTMGNMLYSPPYCTLHREDPPATAVHDLYKYRPQQCTLCTCTWHVAMFCGSVPTTPTRTAVAYCLL